MRFARSVDGAWCDPVEAATLTELDTRFHPDWVAARKASGEWFQMVSDVVWNTLMPPIVVTVTHDEKVALGISDRNGAIKARAALLIKKGQTTDALALLQTLGE